MTRTVEIRFNLLRNGAWAGELIALESSTPTLRMNDAADIKTSLSGDFAVLGEANWLTDEIQPVLSIDGTPHSLGIYLPSTVQEVENETTRSVHIEAFDRCWLVQDHYTEDRHYIASGTNYITAIKTLLEAAGVAAVLATASSLTTSIAREDWEIGTSYLEIVNQLLSEINYKPLYFNEEGVAILEPATVPTASSIRQTLDSSKVESLLLPQISRETDVYRTPNVFICVVSSADRNAVMIATAENTNPQSPLSIARRGRRIAAVYRVDSVANQTELQAYADRLRNESMISGETVMVQTALLPGFGVADAIALHYGDFSDICVEHAWTMALVPGGTMTHTMERVVVNLD